jgi:aldehyde:ferredoxin oxidoreductase
LLELLADVNRRLMLPLEQLGTDVMDTGLGLAALFEGVSRGLIPPDDAPDFCFNGGGMGNLEAAVSAVDMLRSGHALEYPALRAVGDGPQALAQQYPGMQEIVYTGGPGTLANAGHSNTLWTFLTPFSRFFGHYVGQYYKITEELPAPNTDPQFTRDLFRRVIARLLQREFFWLLSNALSQCAFTFVIFSQDGTGERLGDDKLLIRVLEYYGIHTTRDELEEFAQRFWAQSIDFKIQYGWQPPAAHDFPFRVYEGLALALDREAGELQELMDQLIEEWKYQAAKIMHGFGYSVPW